MAHPRRVDTVALEGLGHADPLGRVEHLSPVGHRAGRRGGDVVQRADRRDREITMQAGAQTGFDRRGVAVEQLRALGPQDLIAHDLAPQSDMVHQKTRRDSQRRHRGDVFIVQERRVLGAMPLGGIPRRQFGHRGEGRHHHVQRRITIAVAHDRPSGRNGFGEVRFQLLGGEVRRATGVPAEVVLPHEAGVALVGSVGHPFDGLRAQSVITGSRNDSSTGEGVEVLAPQ